MLKNLNKRQSIIILTILILITSILAYCLSRKHIDLSKLSFNRKKNPDWFLKSLHTADNLNKIGKILIETNKNKLTIIKEKDNWLILEKNNYAAFPIRIKELIFGLADLRIIDSKTSNPNNFATIDVKDLETSDNTTKISFFTSNHEEIDSVYIGKREFIATPNINYQSYIFVRRPSENQAWLVVGNLPEGFSFKELVKQPLINLELNKISGLNLTKIKDPRNRINIKKNTSDGKFNLLDIPKGYKLKDEYLLDNLIQQFTYLNYEDVLKDQGDSVSVLNGKIFLLSEQEQVHNKSIIVDFELVYLNNNYYLRLFSNLLEHTNYANWLYKISDYACQSLLINKFDLLDKV